MRNSEEINLRENYLYDPAVSGFDSVFLKGDTADLSVDTVRNALKIGDTGLVGSVSSYKKFLFGDFEFAMNIDSLSPDSNDSEKYFGLRNRGDTLNRGAMYFDLSYDTETGDSSVNARSFRAVAYDEAGNRQEKDITWDTDWGGGGRTARFRIRWEQDQVQFLVNDTIYATLGDRPDGKISVYQLNNTIPQAIRISNRSLDTTTASCTALKTLVIRNSRIIS